MNKVFLFVIVCLAACTLASNRASSAMSMRAQLRKGCCKCAAPSTGCCDCAHHFVTDYIDVPEPIEDEVPMSSGEGGKARVPLVDKSIYSEHPAVDFGNKNHGVSMVSAIAMLPDSPDGLRGNIILTESSSESTSSFPADKAKTVGNPCDCSDHPGGDNGPCQKYECGQYYGMTKGIDYSTLTAPKDDKYSGISGAQHTKCNCPAGVHCPCMGGREPGSEANIFQQEKANPQGKVPAGAE